MSEGEMVRFIDVPVPPRSAGGIFDQLDPNDGSVGEIRFLMTNDHSERLLRLTSDFVKSAKSNDGWDERFARKFGVFAAAGQLAVEAGFAALAGRMARRGCAALS